MDMTDQQVFQLLCDKIDSLDEKVVEGFRRVNGRLDKHDDTINSVQQHGCARFARLHDAEQESKAKAVSQQAGLIGVVSVTVVGLIELLKVLVGKL